MTSIKSFTLPEIKKLFKEYVEAANESEPLTKEEYMVLEDFINFLESIDKSGPIEVEVKNNKLLIHIKNLKKNTKYLVDYEEGTYAIYWENDDTLIVAREYVKPK